MHSHSTHVSIMHTAAQKLLFHGHEGVFYQSFSCHVSFTYETTLSVCQGAIPSSISLLKQGQVRQIESDITWHGMHALMDRIHACTHPCTRHAPPR
jgi:hypothetical protein